MHLTYLAVYTHLVDIEAGLILYLKKSNLSPDSFSYWKLVHKLRKEHFQPAIRDDQ